MTKQIIYWHRRLPPVSAEPVEEHTLEVTSNRVKGVISERNELWDRCYFYLMVQTDDRMAQEVARLEGDYAHVIDESIESHRDEATGEAWLQGRFTYMLYKEPSAHPDSAWAEQTQAAQPDGSEGVRADQSTSGG